MPEELSLIRFSVINFFSILINSRPFQPIASLLLKMVEAIIHSEPEPDNKNLDRLKWIYSNTHKEVEESLPIVELAVFKNLERGLNREIDIGNKSFYLVELYKYLDEISKELSNIVIEIAKKYSLDLPLNMTNTGTTRISVEDSK
jgi:hypothetical protein